MIVEIIEKIFILLIRRVDNVGIEILQFSRQIYIKFNKIEFILWKIPPLFFYISLHSLSIIFLLHRLLLASHWVTLIITIDIRGYFCIYSFWFSCQVVRNYHIHLTIPSYDSESSIRWVARSALRCWRIRISIWWINLKISSIAMQVSNEFYPRISVFISML